MSIYIIKALLKTKAGKVKRFPTALREQEFLILKYMLSLIKQSYFLNLLIIN